MKPVVSELILSLERAKRRVLELEKGVSQMQLLAMLPLPPVVVLVVKTAQRLVDAVDACNREDERAEREGCAHSSAPMVRYINTLGELRRNLAALKEAYPDPDTKPQRSKR